MDFIGQGIRLQAGEVGEVARSIDVETAALLAFMDVEAAGSGFDTRKRPKVLPEPHRFYAELGATPARDRAVREGLAYARWGARPYPRTFDARFDQIRSGMRINQDAALRACSWGLGQVLGSNCRSAGFGSALAMVHSAMVSEKNQLQHMANFLLNEEIAPKMRGVDLTKADNWRPIARPYNGPGYATHNYHGRMASSYVKHKRKEGLLVGAAPEVLARGMRGEAVMNLQRDLIQAGYTVVGGPDGVFGQQTDIAVRTFQHDNHLTVDGRFGPQSVVKLAEILARVVEDNDPAPPVWDGQEDGVDPFDDVRTYISQQRSALDHLEAALPKKE